MMPYYRIIDAQGKFSARLTLAEITDYISFGAVRLGTKIEDESGVITEAWEIPVLAEAFRNAGMVIQSRDAKDSERAEQAIRHLDESIQQHRNARLALNGITKKRCPDCAEIVKIEARKCRFCGYEF